MKLAASLRSLVSALLHRSRVEREMDEELRSHIRARADHLVRSGLSCAEAERRARIEFGGYERFREESRQALGTRLLDGLARDVRFGARMLRKSPSFTIAAVAALAVAIGANAVVFGALDAIILRPLNVPRAESLYALQPRSNEVGLEESYPNYLDLRDRNRSFDGLAAYTIAEAGLDTGENPSPAWLYEVSGNYFDVLGIQPYLGRFFHASDERGPDSAPYVVLAYAYWHSHFQDDRGVVGRAVQLDKHPFTVIGVAPPGFHGTLLFFSPAVFVPLIDGQQIEGPNLLNARGNEWLFLVMGHLKPGVSRAQAVADLNSIGAYLKKTYPKDERRFSFALTRPSLYGDFVGRPARAFLTALMLLAGLILLAACANLGSLFAARAGDRSRELALRLALGAGRPSIVRQLFTEAMLISLMGGAAGLWGGVTLLRWLNEWQPFPRIPINIPVNPDATVYGAALVLALASGFLFGAAPVRQVLRTDPYQVVKSGSPGAGGPRRMAGRDLLLVAQIAICAVLMTASIVAVRGLARSLHGNFGFEPRNAMLVDTDLGMAGYRGEQVPAMQRRIFDAMKAIPGVESAGMVDWAPLSLLGWRSATVFTDKTADLRPSNAAADVVAFSISPEYFRAAGTALLAGRDVDWRDGAKAPPVAVIDDVFARRFFGSARNAVGGHFKLRDGTRLQVVGVVATGKYETLTETPAPAVFLPLLQAPSSETILVLRSRRDPQQLAAAARMQLRNLDAGLPAFIQTWTRTLDAVLFPARVATVSLGILGVLGAMLSVTGIFGMAAYSVSKRKRELGIRIALGAQPREVLRAALGRALKLLGYGSAAGLLLGILASRLLASIVYQATPRDPLVLTGVVVAMLLLGFLATWIPAQRALSIDPLILLHEE